MNKVFPTVLIALDILAALAYALDGGYLRKCVYWLSAAALTASITY